MESDSGKTFGDSELIVLLNGRYGTKPLLQHYLAKAKGASARARVALASQNPYALGAEAQTMIDNIEMIYKIIGDESRNITAPSE